MTTPLKRAEAAAVLAETIWERRHGSFSPYQLRVVRDLLTALACDVRALCEERDGLLMRVAALRGREAGDGAAHGPRTEADEAELVGEWRATACSHPAERSCTDREWSSLLCPVHGAGEREHP